MVFVAFFGAALLAIVRFNSFEVRKNEAHVAGWELVTIAKAARLFVRDQYALNANLRVTAQNPSQITLTMLENAGYLPKNFGRKDTGGNDINALNQRIFVIMTNWPMGAITAATVPSAFVYFAPGGKSARELAVEMVTTARQENAAITAPLYNLADVNVSADCRGGGPAAALWDTGCLTQAEFATLTTAVGQPTVVSPGSLIMPAWKSVQPDLRAVMRFPSPENPGYATMLTDLGMGTPVGSEGNICGTDSNQVHFTTTDASGNMVQTSTNVCAVKDDTATENNRFNINHVGNIIAQRLVAEPQTQDFGPEANVNIGNANGGDDAMRVNGDVALSTDLRVFNVKPLPLGETSRFDVPNGTVVVERNAYANSKNPAAIGHVTAGNIATANALISDELNSNRFTSVSAGTTTGAPQMNVTNVTALTGNLSVQNPGASAELITETMTGLGADVEITDPSGSKAQISGTLNMAGSTATVLGANPGVAPGGFSTITGEITDTGTVNVTSTGGGSNDDLHFIASNASVTSGTTSNDSLSGPLPVINTARCVEGLQVADACANRQFVPPNITP